MPRHLRKKGDVNYRVRKNRWDDWVPQDRVRKFNDDNKELAAQLEVQMKQLQQKGGRGGQKNKGGARTNGSDFSSTRASEERHASVAAQSGRGGSRRNRDYDLESVSPVFLILRRPFGTSFGILRDIRV